MGFGEVWLAFKEGLGQALSFFYDLVPNYGAAILLLTVAVRVLLIPLGVKQARSMKKMQGLQAKMKELKPQLDEIKEKHKDDRRKVNEEQMKLYQEHGVNPLGTLGGCLPLLLQMPVLFALFKILQVCAPAAKKCTPGSAFVPAGSALRGVLEGAALGGSAASLHFLGMNLIKTPAQAVSEGILGAIPYLLTIGVMSFSTWGMTKLLQQSQPTPDPSAPGANIAKTMQRVMPVMLAVFSFNFPAGLVLYWTAYNLWMMGQQPLLTRWIGRSDNPTGSRKIKADPLVPPPAATSGNGQSDPNTPSGNGDSQPARSKPHSRSKKRKKRKRKRR